ncbi:hypothetical protein [Rubrivirga sp.]|uniref:hypothetical protein n=1 Tax=Rubrivirga sp. TaxID=1885344 RepID=UPI003C78D452
MLLHHAPRYAWGQLGVPTQRMMARLILVLVLATAPQAQPTATAPPSRYVQYLEALGNGGIGSMNIERRLGEDLAIRVGVGWAPDLEGQGSFTAPVLVGYVPSDGGVEVSLGLVLRYRQGLAEPWGTVAAGYRWVRPGGAVFRATFTPIDLGPSGVFPSIGLSIGSEIRPLSPRTTASSR